MKIKEVERTRGENLFEHSELFSSVAGRSVAFSQDFIVSLDFFGLVYPELAEGFFYQEKNEHIDNQYIRRICYVELR